MEIAKPELEAYAEAHTTPPEPLLAELAEETRESLRSPQMLTGTIEGRFLELLVLGAAGSSTGPTTRRTPGRSASSTIGSPPTSALPP